MDKLGIITDAIPLFSALESQYEELSKLELAELKNSQKYKESLENIKLINEVINKKLAHLIIDYDNFLDYKAILMEKNNIPPFDIANLDDFILNNDNYLKRLINHLYFLSKDINFELDESFMKINNDDIIIDATNYLSLMSSISDMLDKLLLLTLFEYLLEEINKTVSIKVRNQLIKVKYRLLFLYPELELYFLYNKDNHSKAVSVSKYLLNVLKNIDTDCEAFKEICEGYLYKNIIELATRISKLDEDFFNIEKNEIIVLIRGIIIKTFISINFDLSISQKLEQDKSELLNNTKSEKAKQYLLQSFSLNDKLNVPKIVDL